METMKINRCVPAHNKKLKNKTDDKVKPNQSIQEVGTDSMLPNKQNLHDEIQYNKNIEKNRSEETNKLQNKPQYCTKQMLSLERKINLYQKQKPTKERIEEKKHSKNKQLKTNNTINMINDKMDNAGEYNFTKYSSDMYSAQKEHILTDSSCFLPGDQVGVRGRNVQNNTCYFDDVDFRLTLYSNQKSLQLKGGMFI